jgi:hypothetical protein
LAELGNKILIFSLQDKFDILLSNQMATSFNFDNLISVWVHPTVIIMIFHSYKKRLIFIYMFNIEMVKVCSIISKKVFFVNLFLHCNIGFNHIPIINWLNEYVTINPISHGGGGGYYDHGLFLPHITQHKHRSELPILIDF